MEREIVNLTGVVIENIDTGEVEQYIIVWRNGQQEKVLEQLSKWAADPQLSFSKLDAVKTAVAMNEEAIDYDLEASFAERWWMLHGHE